MTAYFGGLGPESLWALLGIMGKLELPLPAFGLFSIHTCSNGLGLTFLGVPTPGAWLLPAMMASEDLGDRVPFYFLSELLVRVA